MIESYCDGVTDVPAGTYQGQTEPSPQVVVPNVLVVRPDMPQQLQQDITRVIFDNEERLANVHPAAKALDVATAGDVRFVEVCAGARAYFDQTGSPNVDLPAKFDGATLVVRVTAAALLEYRSSTGSGPGQPTFSHVWKLIPQIHRERCLIEARKPVGKNSRVAMISLTVLVTPAVVRSYSTESQAKWVLLPARRIVKPTS